MNKIILRISTVLGVAALALFAMTLSGATRPTTASAEATEIVVHAVDGAYAPSVISAPADSPFTIRMINDDTFDNEHDIRVKDSTGATIAKMANTCFGPCEATVSVPALSAGVYTFYCIVHDDMNGELDVG